MPMWHYFYLSHVKVQVDVVIVGYVCDQRVLSPIGDSYMMTHQRHNGALWVGVELFGLVCYPQIYF